MNRFIDRDHDRFAKRAELVKATITPELVLSFLKALQAPAPSGTVEETRMPILRALSGEVGISDKKFDGHYLGTNSPAIVLNEHPNLVVSAHSDQPSYRIPQPTAENAFVLEPNFAHRPTTDTQFSGSVIRRTPKGVYEVISTGTIFGTKDSARYEGKVKDKVEFNPGLDRVVFTQEMIYDPETRLVSGNIDNAAGDAVLLASLAGVIAIRNREGSKLKHTGTVLVLPDEEEGVPVESGTFARGARKLAPRLQRISQKNTTILNFDGHDMTQPSAEAIYAAYSSAGKGATTYPPLYQDVSHFAEALGSVGIALVPSEGKAKVSRSDDPAYGAVFDKIILAGYGVTDPHHNEGLPTAHLDSLVNAAHFIAMAIINS